VSRHAFVHGKMSNQRRLQQAMYAEIRAVYRLPAQMACNVPRKARSHLQGTLDEDQEECRPAKGGPDSETLPRTGRGSQVCLPHAYLQLSSGLQPETRCPGEYPD